VLKNRNFVIYPGFKIPPRFFKTLSTGGGFTTSLTLSHQDSQRTGLTGYYFRYYSFPVWSYPNRGRHSVGAEPWAGPRERREFHYGYIKFIRKSIFISGLKVVFRRAISKKKWNLYIPGRI
jgi:hypothetical protein